MKRRASQIYKLNILAAHVYERKNSGKAMQILGKRPAEENRVACTTKKRALDVNVGPPRMSNLNGTAVSSGISSLNTEKGKGRAAHEFSEIPCSPSASRIQASKSNLYIYIVSEYAKTTGPGVQT